MVWGPRLGVTLTQLIPICDPDLHQKQCWEPHQPPSHGLRHHGPALLHWHQGQVGVPRSWTQHHPGAEACSNTSRPRGPHTRTPALMAQLPNAAVPRHGACHPSVSSQRQSLACLITAAPGTRPARTTHLPAEIINVQVFQNLDSLSPKRL